MSALTIAEETVARAKDWSPVPDWCERVAAVDWAKERGNLVNAMVLALTGEPLSSVWNGAAKQAAKPKPNGAVE